MIGPDDPRHETYAGYQAGCREGCCRDAAAAYRRHLYGHHYLHGHKKIDPTGTIRRLRALRALGWTWEALDAELERVTGKKRAPGHVHRRHSKHANGALITTATAAEYAALYDDLSMRLPAPGYGTTRARAHARKRGWLPPLAWDDHRIDDPTYQPTPARTTRKSPAEVDEAVVVRVLAGEHHLRTTRAEKEEILRRWVAAGNSESSLCRQLGWRDTRYSEGRAS